MHTNCDEIFEYETAAPASVTTRNYEGGTDAYQWT